MHLSGHINCPGFSGNSGYRDDCVESQKLAFNVSLVNWPTQYQCEDGTHVNHQLEIRRSSRVPDWGSKSDIDTGALPASAV
jgi:hypothetical protein